LSVECDKRCRTLIAGGRIRESLDLGSGVLKNYNIKNSRKKFHAMREGQKSDSENSQLPHIFQHLFSKKALKQEP
jgi:hypothetical protein